MNVNSTPMKNVLNKFSLLIIMILVMNISCKKFLPTDKDSFASDTRFSQVVYEPVLGRSTLFNTFVPGNSTQPLTFKILNPRRTTTGEVATELDNVFPIKVWKSAYTGLETSLNQIEEKRAIENHKIFEVREHSGQFIIWPIEKADNFMLTRPDSGYLFDVEVSNSGGRKYFRDMKLMPYRSRPFEPTNADPITGHNTNTPVHPTIMSYVNSHKDGSNDVFAYMGPWDVDITFAKVGNGNSLKFVFQDTLQNPINPDMFNQTKWNELVHGFNMEKTAEYVKYDVAYPIPLTPLVTKYTNTTGTRASVNFSWDRLVFGGERRVARIQFDFAIFEQGDWEIYLWFKNANPKFIND